jgi:hypothetical protein
VTDEGSLLLSAPATCLYENPRSTPITAQIAAPAGSAAVFPRRWPPQGLERWWRCIICGRRGRVVDPFSRFSRSGPQDG